MSEATPPQYAERGGFLQRDHFSHHPQSTQANRRESLSTAHITNSSSSSITEHDYRFPRRPDHLHDSSTANSSATTAASSLGSDHDKLDLSAADTAARKHVLRESVFSTWKDDAGGADLESPDEMQKKDPLATQIWRLYSKTKKQLPNQERMENLTWRMMAMNLRKRKQEEAARYANAVIGRLLFDEPILIIGYLQIQSTEPTDQRCWTKWHCATTEVF